MQVFQRTIRWSREAAGLILPGVVLLSAISFGQTPAEWLNGHNKYRRTLVTHDGKPTSTPDLVWNETLAKDAQEWATKMAASGEFKHRPNSSTSKSSDARAWGENIAFGSSATYSGLEGLTAWYDEKPFFLPATSKCSPGNDCGHFTQVVSQLSREVGCATGTGANGTYAVCNYNPHGNDVSNGSYADLYPGQKAPAPGGALFASLKADASLDIMFNDCLKTAAEGLLAAAVPSTAGTPVDLPGACGFTKIRSYDSGVLSGYTGAEDKAAGTFINYRFQGKVLGTSGGVAVSVNPPRAVLLTGE
ncbi:MAG: CAP domain-containing protein [Acidobacteria bacterium]|nr:CAP domain-containing protein [Acidobacteriota bacterium]